MDGTRTVPEVVAAMLDAVPGGSYDEAARVVDALVNSGHLEDAAAPPPDLPAADLIRHSRGQVYFQHVDLVPRDGGWHAQLALRRSAVVVLGLGGTGGHAAWALTAAGVGRVHCVDDDVVELSNLNRQVLYAEADVGRPKVDAALERLRQVNSGVVLTGERRRITSAAGLADLVDGFDLLVLCADEPRDLRGWAARTGKPWVGGGYHGPLVTVGVFAPGHPCWECLVAGEAARRTPGTPSDLTGGGGATSASAGLSGHLTAQAALTLLTGIPPIPPGYLYGLNLLALDAPVHVRHPGRPACPVCDPPGPSGS
ncbi:MAG: ThiF family adenylyltransferase [Nonomuraea sp.]|nr:ThiF family adenylyltransferase [Nonomuraea sp.]